MNIKQQAAILASAAALSVASPQAAHAQSQGAEQPVAVAVVDVLATKIDHKDPNVRVVRLNEGEQKFRSRDARGDFGVTHGDSVASSFVREYRKLEPTRPIVIYSINPMKELPNGDYSLDLGAIQKAMPALKAGNVKAVVMALGLQNKESGDRLIAPFKAANITVFAAVPNDPFDKGIYPAASKDTISVGTPDTNGYLNQNPKAASWVDFEARGYHRAGKMRDDVNGTSFAVAHVAAYGAYLGDRNPAITTAEMRAQIAAAGDRGDRQTVRLDGKDMTSRFLAAHGQSADQAQVAMLYEAQRRAAGASR